MLQQVQSGGRVSAATGPAAHAASLPESKNGQVPAQIDGQLRALGGACDFVSLI